MRTTHSEHVFFCELSYSLPSVFDVTSHSQLALWCSGYDS